MKPDECKQMLTMTNLSQVRVDVGEVLNIHRQQAKLNLPEQIEN
jgi:hypothetical protein